MPGFIDPVLASGTRGANDRALCVCLFLSQSVSSLSHSLPSVLLC